ncbi:MAG TPA: outer membrane protein assembly factor BamD [Myxococcaceae bacterium]|nr:outer membrane protein assembly factor BamD [Myxococcaceae bacterium]
MSRASVLLFLPLLFALGCSTTATQKVDAAIAEADSPEIAAKRAEERLARGDEALSRNDYQGAAMNYDFVRVSYPYLEAATTAELRLADVDFASEMWASARDRYQTFIKLHPTSKHVDYAAYRAALTWYRQTPSDFFLLPSPTTKDQSAQLAAHRELNAFIRNYPESELLDEAKATLQEVENQLAQHELNVATFYGKQDRWKAATLRLQTLVTRYPTAKTAPRALLELHGAALKAEQPKVARGALETLVAKHPETSQAKRAQTLLAAAPGDDADAAERAPAEETDADGDDDLGED